MMDAQTRGLLQECSLGCKMAINSFDQMRDYVKNEELKELMNAYDKKHNPTKKKPQSSWQKKDCRKKSRE